MTAAPLPPPSVALPFSAAPGGGTIAWPSPQREQAFSLWLARVAPAHALAPDTLVSASADASFRRYFRIQAASGGFIIMDAPPPQEDVRPFIDVAARLAQAGLHAPQVLQADVAQGFLLLTDLGHEPYLAALKAASPAQADALMRQAIGALVQLQQRMPTDGLPRYDEALLRRELELFPEWCVQREYGVVWGDKQHATWQRVSQALVASALGQPVVAVHRDWMPRNLMVAEPNPGILDFQDAVAGPITYDMASMLRDAFWSWDEERELDWAVRYWQAARSAGLPLGDALGADFGEFWRALEWMGLQRHLKVMGIFSRLKHRDGKPAYAQDLPRFFAYATKVAARYIELKPLIALLEELAGPLTTQGFSLR